MEFKRVKEKREEMVGVLEIIRLREGGINKEFNSKIGENSKKNKKMFMKRYK